MSHSASDRSLSTRSPCINVCVLGSAGYCLGCLRTGDEIARWRDMSARRAVAAAWTRWLSAGRCGLQRAARRGFRVKVGSQGCRRPKSLRGSADRRG